MSDRLAAKIKENAGKPKYSSLNLNQTYKGNKVEIKTSSGATRHGLQSLGKIGSSRRIPPPANLPSLKSENSGNDPTVSLVPSGGGGWGSTKDKSDSAALTSSSTPPPSSFHPSQPTVAVSQQPSLQPQRPTAPSSFPSSQPPSQQQSQNSGPTRQDTTTTSQQEKSETQTKTWGSVSQSEAGGQGKTFSHQPTPYFNREFPTLGGQDSGEIKQDGKDSSYGPAPIVRNTHEPPWMERSGPGPPPHGYGRNQDLFNGGPGQGPHYRRPPADYQNNRNNAQYPPQHYGNNYYPGPGGRAPPPPHGYSGPDQHGRPPYPRPGQGSQRQGPRPDKRQDSDRESEKPAIRPSVLRPEDIQAMDDEDDDGGWAGAHGEVDYTAKLNFEDFDDEEKDWSKEHKLEKSRPSKEREDHKMDKDEERQTTEVRKEPEGQKEPVLLRRTQDAERPKPPTSAWGELPQRPPQYNDTNRQGPQPLRPFDSHRPVQTPPWNTQHPTPNQAQHRVPPGQYPPLSGSPPTGRDPSPGRPPKQEGSQARREGEPMDEWTVRRQKQQEEMHAAVERARKRIEQEELEFQAKQKAAAMMKLKAMEERAKSTDEKPEENHERTTEKQRSESVGSDGRRDTRDISERTRDEKDIEQNLQSEQKLGLLRPEDSSRRRTDSDSSDASRSSGSRQYYHQQRSIPPRFQQQRQQQQQQYQQQQLYQATQSVHHQQPRELLETAPTGVRPPQTIDSGPVSPSGKTSRPIETVPVKRIMKRSDSSSTAGDDVASVKSLESVGDREKERGSRSRLGTGSSTEQEVIKPETKPKPRDSEAQRKESKESRKDEVPEEKARDIEKHHDAQRTPEKKAEDREDETSTTAPRKREYHSNDRKIEEPYKRKRDENDEGEYDDRRSRVNRERQTDGRGRLGRLGTSLRGRGRGIGRGRQEYRSSDNRQRNVRDSRSRDSKENRSRKESTEKSEKPREPLKTEDQNKDAKEKVSTDDTKEKSERLPLKKEEKSASDRENQERKTSRQERPPRETQERDRNERKGDRYEKKNERYEKRDDRDQRPKWKPSESKRESKDHRDEPRRGRFAYRDYREEEKYANQRYNRDGDRYKHDKPREKERETDVYKEKPRESDQKDKAKEREPDVLKDKPKEREPDAYKDKPRERESEAYKDKSREREYEVYKDKPKERETESYKDKPKEREPYQDRERPRRDYDRYKDRESPRNRRELTARHDRGGHRGQLSTRGRGGGTSGRGARRGTGGRIGSGRIVASYGRQTKREELSSEDEDDDSGSESSSYTTATSASEERPDEKEEKPKEQPRSASQSSNASRGLKSTRGTRGRGGSYQRSRPQQEKPPRFQRQQERAAQQRSSSRGGFRSDRPDAVRGSRGRGRGRGRGRIVSRDTEDTKDDPAIEATEDWEDDVDSGPKDQTKEERPPRRGGFPPRPSSDRNTNQRRGTSRDESGKSVPRRDGSLHSSQQRKGEPFLAEKQVKIDGSKSASGEPRGALPAAKNTDLASSKKSSGTPKDDKRVDYGAVDSIDGKVPVKRNETVKKANIELFDLHNVAGVICIDEFPDDASDISSSGFVEVTSKRTQKELKEKQREEDERRKRTEEKANQRNADSKFKKNQANKPPRFSKQHQGPVPTQSKSFEGKLPVTISLEGAPGLVTGNIGSNSSSTNSTKRNSPVTVERPLSPQGPVFNAWNKPLTLVTPAKPPGTSLVMASNVPDPLAVGSGKPSRQTQPTTVMPLQNSLIYSNIEDKSAEDELKEMTKEIESMAPSEEQEEVSAAPSKSNKKSSGETSSREKRHDGEKKSQPKPQRERPPRFERTAKRKGVIDEKKDLAAQDQDKDKEASSKLSGDESSEALLSKTITENKEFDSVNRDEDREKTPNVDSTSKGIELVDNDTDDKENEKDSVAPRKDSDYSVDSEEQGSGDSSMFSGRPLSVDITDSSSETQDRPPTPVSPAYAEMSKRMFAARKAWDCAPSSVGLTTVGMDSPSAWSESSSSSVTRSAVSTKDASPLAEGSSDSETRESSEASVTKSDVTKPAETQFIAKKTGGSEQQNVCKVKPQQQQQTVKPQHASISASTTEERRPTDLDTMAPAQPVLTQDHLLPQNIHSSYQFQLEPQLLQLQHRQPQHFMQPLQSLQQSTQVPANRYQIPAQMQQVPHQPTSAPSPLSQSPQELFQSQYLASNLYSASGFPGSQPFVSIPMVATTTTPSYATSSTRTQTLPGQPAKTATSSMFGQPGSQTQTVYMPFDPQNIGGTATLLNFNQQSQAQRQLMGNHPVGFPDVLTQQPHMPQGNQPQAPQQFQRPFTFQKPTSFESEHGASLKPVDQVQGDFSQPQSDMVKHINAKPFEPPKRLSTPTSLATSSGGNVGLLTSGVNPNVVHIRPNPPNMGALSHSPPMQTSYISNRPVSMSPVDPNVPFAAGANSFAKHAPIGPYQVPQQRQQPPVQQFTPFQQQPVHIKPQQLQQHQAVHLQQGQPSQHHSQQQHGPTPTHIAASGAPGVPPQALMPRQYGAVGTVGPTQHTVSNQRFPGPIQRPPSTGLMQGIPQNVLQHQPRSGQQPRPIRQQAPRMPHGMQKPPLLSTRPPMPPQQMQISPQQNPFKAMQHQKMLEETRLFFASQEQQQQQSKAKSQAQSIVTDKPPLQTSLQGHLPQQQTQKQGPLPQQSNLKQIQSQSKPMQDSKLTQQHPRQNLHNKQVPLAPSSGAHHQNKPPRMSQENKQKQSTQDKKDRKEENKSHIIELPRKKPQDNGNKSKPNKPDSSKSEDPSQTSKSDGKPTTNKRGGTIRIAPMVQKPPQGNNRGARPNRPRGPPVKNTTPSVQSNKPKPEVSSTSATTTVATGAPTAATTTSTTSKPITEAVVSSKNFSDPSPKETEEVKAADPLTAAS